jgi:hypothetical protein
MDAQDHAGHNTCAAPSCSAFHLFCRDCGGRHHLRDALVTAVTADPAVPAVTTVTTVTGSAVAEPRVLVGQTRSGGTSTR